MATKRQPLSPSAWTEAAYEALAEGGLSAVAVEPLAVRLGATKGSFYSHFANRDALISAVVSLWEKRTTDAVIEWLESDADAESRLRRLFTRASEAAGRDPVDHHLRAASAHPLVKPVLHRVVQRRIAYTVGLFREVGFSEVEATNRGLLAYFAYAGHSETNARLPGVLELENGGGGLPGYVDAALDLLLRDRPAARPPAGEVTRLL
jgi:AcrR family transcriptional regulator